MRVQSRLNELLKSIQYFFFRTFIFVALSISFIDIRVKKLKFWYQRFFCCFQTWSKSQFPTMYFRVVRYYLKWLPLLLSVVILIFLFSEFTVWVGICKSSALCTAAYRSTRIFQRFFFVIKKRFSMKLILRCSPNFVII